MRTILTSIWLRARRSATGLLKDRSGVAAIEFAMIVPIMLVMFFGTVEFSSGVAVDRKVTLMARTLSDLTSQSTKATDCTLTNFFAASNGIMTPYSPLPTIAKITELLVDPTTLQAKVQWSRSATINASDIVVLGTGRTVGTIVPIPTALAVGGQYLIWSEVSYLYKPAVGYVMAPTGVNLSDVSFTRPRQSPSVTYTVACT
jgi:Flp pilus assembly protein TadG